MSEIEKLAQYCEDTGAKILGVTTAYDLRLSDKKPTAEEIAAEINRIHEWLADPVNNLISRIKGHMFLKRDTIMCLENRNRIIDEEPCFVPVPMTEEEAHKVRRLKEDIELFQLAIDMIEELATNHD